MRIVVAGNPNVGKTSLFNRLTGSRYKVGNYAGVTVESREGALHGDFGRASEIRIVDLPGTYSLTPSSEDEQIAYEELASLRGQASDLTLIVVDASNLARNLYLVHQIAELDTPYLVALNMCDVARANGQLVDPTQLEKILGVPVICTSALTGEGVAELVATLQRLAQTPRASIDLQAWGRELEPRSEAVDRCRAALHGANLSQARRDWLICAAASHFEIDCVRDHEREAWASLNALESECIAKAAADIVDTRYADVDAVLLQLAPASSRPAANTSTSDRVDRILTHKIAGPFAFFAVMTVLFQAIFSGADPLIGIIEEVVAASSSWVAELLGPGLFTDLLTEGVIAGVGNVIVFVPQIALLFLFVGLLEDSGYMARAAFIIDRIMSRVGLSGKSFVPLLSGYACAIPAIMGTRSIERFRDRLVTILMIPFASCSARLPIYLLILGALFPVDDVVWGPFDFGGVMLTGIYALSMVSALGIGAIYKRTIIKSPTPPLVLELPPYRVPRLRNTLREVWDRTLDFVRDAGTIILCVTVLLWGLLSFPRVDENQLAKSESAIEYSIGGRAGKAMEPLLEPIGQDWRVGIGIIGSFAAREVLVSTLGLVYGIEGADEDDGPLREKLRNARDEETGKPRYTPLSGLALIVFFIYAAQCMSTLAVVKRETRSWRWPIFMVVSMTLIAYVGALLVYQGGRLLGFE